AIVATIADPKDSGGNCFAGNTFTTSLPANVETLLPCGQPPSPAYATDLGRFASLLLSKKPGANDFRTVALPPIPQLAGMPNPLTAPARPANRGVPEVIELGDIRPPSH